MCARLSFCCCAFTLFCSFLSAFASQPTAVTLRHGISQREPSVLLYTNSSPFHSPSACLAPRGESADLFKRRSRRDACPRQESFGVLGRASTSVLPHVMSVDLFVCPCFLSSWFSFFFFFLFISARLDSEARSLNFSKLANHPRPGGLRILCVHHHESFAPDFFNIPRCFQITFSPFTSSRARKLQNLWNGS